MTIVLSLLQSCCLNLTHLAMLEHFSQVPSPSHRSQPSQILRFDPEVGLSLRKGTASLFALEERPSQAKAHEFCQAFRKAENC